jgi:RNA polymerase sigma-70 factor (ECF subfamily)
MAREDRHVDRDRDYFESLYRAYYGRVLLFAIRRTDPQTARDVVAETFLAAWRRLDTVPRDKALAWLYIVARNTISNELRGRGRRTRLADRLEAQPADSIPDLAEDVAARLDARRLLESLPPKDREALQLVEWEHLDIASAAEVAGCSSATFRVRLHRARRRLVTADGETRQAHPPVQQLITDEALS